MKVMQKEAAWTWVKTIAVLIAMSNAGMNLGIFSPTFPDMAVLTNSSMGKMATTMTWVGLASIIGAACMGPLFDRFDSLLVLSVSLLIQGLSIGMAPWFHFLIVYQIMAGIASIFSTGIMTGGLSANCIIWKKRPEMISPIIQVTDLFHAFGTALTPQIIKPFLGRYQLPDANPTVMPPSANTTASSAGEEGVVEHINTNSSLSHSGPEPIQMAYVLVALLDLGAALVCFLIFVVDRGQTRSKSNDYNSNRMIRSRSYSLNEDGVRIYADEFHENPPKERERTTSLVRVVLEKSLEDKQHQRHNRIRPDVLKMMAKRKELQMRKELRNRHEEEEIKAAESNDPHGLTVNSSVPPVSCSSKILPLFLVVIFFFMINGGRDAMFTGLLFTLLNGYLHWTPSKGTLLVTFYHVTRVVIHIAFVFLAKCVSPALLIVVNIIFLLVSSALMLVTVNASPIFTILAVLLTGFATSNLHATAITLAQRSFLVDGKVMGMLIGAVFCGTSVVSLIAGFLLDSYGAITFPVILLAITAGGILFFAVWLIVARSVRKNSSTPLVAEVVVVDEKTALISQ